LVKLQSQPGAAIQISIAGTIDVEATAIIGPAGGTVQVTNPQSSLFGTELFLPSGALSKDTTISIAMGTPPQLLPGFKAAGPAVDFLPDGLTRHYRE